MVETPDEINHATIGAWRRNGQEHREYGAMTVEVAALATALFAMLLIAGFALATGAPPTPTSPRVARVLMVLAGDNVRGTVYELGSGWGTLAFPLADRFPENQVVGIEVSPLPWLVSWLRQALAPRSNLTLQLGNYHNVPLNDAGMVVCYLHPEGMERLRVKLEAELRPGSLVLCNTFAVRGWNPVAEAEADDLYRSRVFLYRR